MALLRQHCCELTPFRTQADTRMEVDVIRSGCCGRPVLSTELQPPRSLSASHFCLNMSQDGGQCRIDVSILEALWLTTTTGQYNLCFNRLSTILFGRFASLGRCVLCFFRGRLVGVSEENSRPLPHIDESGSLADQKLILFVQFNIDRTLQLGKPGRRRGDAPRWKQNGRAFTGEHSVSYLYYVFFNFYRSE